MEKSAECIVLSHGFIVLILALLLMGEWGSVQGLPNKENKSKSRRGRGRVKRPHAAIVTLERKVCRTRGKSEIEGEKRDGRWMIC